MSAVKKRRIFAYFSRSELKVPLSRKEDLPPIRHKGRKKRIFNFFDIQLFYITDFKVDFFGHKVYEVVLM